MSTGRKHIIESSILNQLLFEEEMTVRMALYTYAIDYNNAFDVDLNIPDATNANTYKLNEGKPAQTISDDSELTTNKQIQSEIKKIENELYSEFHQKFEDDELPEEYLDGELIFSPRYYFLIARRKQLIKKQNNASQTTPTDSTVPDTAWEKASEIFEIAKKPIDTTDDVWGAVRAGIASSHSDSAQKIAASMAAATPYVIGTTGFILATYEANISRKKLEKAINNPNTRLREIKIATHLAATTNFSLASASSIGLMIMAGVHFVGGLFTSPVISALMTLGFGARLTKNAISLDDYKETLQGKKKDHKLLLTTTNNDICNKNEKINQIQQEKNGIHKKIETLLHQKVIANKNIKDATNTLIVDELNSTLTTCDRKISKYNATLKEKTTAQIKLHDEISALRTNYLKKENEINYTHIKQKTRGAERKVAAGAIEVTASSMVFAGSLLGVMTLTSTVTFGAAPLALLITGVVLASAMKIFEYVDEKNDHKYSNGMRKFFKHGFAKIKSWFGSDKENNKTQETNTPNMRLSTTAIQSELPRPSIARKKSEATSELTVTRENQTSIASLDLAIYNRNYHRIYNRKQRSMETSNETTPDNRYCRHG